MDEILKLKAEAFDLMTKLGDLRFAMQGTGEQIDLKVNEINAKMKELKQKPE
jgi:hypothetical protein